MAERRVCMQSRGYEETELEFDADLVTGSDIQHFRSKVKSLFIKPPVSKQTCA